MSKSPIPAGYHDAEGAAKLLGVSKREMLSALRELAWVNIGGEQHNLPRRELITAGFMATQTGSYCLKGKKEIVKTYSALLLSQKGFQELKIRMEQLKSDQKKSITPAPIFKKAPVVAIEKKPEKPYDKAAAEIERNKHIAQMAEWGLPIAAGRN